MSDIDKGRRVTHIGMLVSDIEASTRFYCEALGFQSLCDTLVIGSEFGKLSGAAADTRLKLRFIERDGFRIELMSGGAAGAQGKPARDRFGLWHVCLNVADLEQQIEKIRELGGDVREETRTAFDLPNGEAMEIIYCSDPDGQPIELTRMSEAMIGKFELISQGKARI